MQDNKKITIPRTSGYYNHTSKEAFSSSFLFLSFSFNHFVPTCSEMVVEIALLVLFPGGKSGLEAGKLLASTLCVLLLPHLTKSVHHPFQEHAECWSIPCLGSKSWHSSLSMEQHHQKPMKTRPRCCQNDHSNRSSSFTLFHGKLSGGYLLGSCNSMDHDFLEEQPKSNTKQLG